MAMAVAVAGGAVSRPSLCCLSSPAPSANQNCANVPVCDGGFRVQRLQSELRSGCRKGGGGRLKPKRAEVLWGVAVASLKDAEQLVKSGVVRNVAPEDVSGLLSRGEYKLLDVRPIWEREKAHVAGSYHVPLFVEDMSTGALPLLKKGIQMGQGGWWIGLKLTTRNDQFLQQVLAKVPQKEKLLVACGEGLRSLLAVEELSDAGYGQLGWLRGGFNSVRDDAIDNVEGTTRLRFATLGGVSEYLLKIALFFQSLRRSAN